jgi:hypothetical protein
MTPLLQLVFEAGAALLRPGHQTQGGPLGPVASCGKAKGSVFISGNFPAGEKIIIPLIRGGQIEWIKGKQGAIRKADAEKGPSGLGCCNR